MTPQIWIAILGGACTVMVTLATWGFLAGSEQQRARQLARELEDYKRECEKKFDHANEATSKAMSYIQGAESRYIREFANADFTNQRFQLVRADLDRLQQAVDQWRRAG